MIFLYPPPQIWTLIPLGVALGWAARLLVANSARHRRGKVEAVTTLVSQVLILIGFGALGWIAFLMTLSVVGMVLYRLRQTEAQGLLAFLDHAMGQGLPLARACRMYANEQHGDLRRRGQLLTIMLEDGWPLGAAFDRVGYDLPMHARYAIGLFDENPQLRKVVRLATDETRQVAALWGMFWERGVYFVVFLMMLPAMASFLAYKILPTYRQIFEDFGVPYPQSATFLVHLDDSAWKGGIILMLPVVMPIVFLGPLLFIANYNGWITWRPRWMQRWTFPLDAAFFCRTLGVALREHVPLLDFLNDVLNTHPRSLLRERVNDVRRAVESGGDWVDALEQNRLLRPVDAAMVRSAQRVGNLEFAWQHMAEGMVRRWRYRIDVTLQMVMPILTLLCGLLVAWLVFVIFVPLIRLLEVMS